jgi:hypothetical protein
MTLTNRRNVIAAAGATAVLAACGKGEKQEKGSKAAAAAMTPDHDDPTEPPKGTPNNDRFRYYKLIVLRTVNGALNATYASFAFDNPNLSENEALEVVRTKIANADPNWGGDVGNLAGIAGNSLGSGFDIRTFGFASKHRVYFYCFDEKSRFPKSAKDALVFNNIDYSGRSLPISDNQSFYRAKIGDYSSGDRKFLCIENHYKDRNGKIADGIRKYYSFNLFLEVEIFVDPARASTKTLLSEAIKNPPTLKIMIDPTTGNGNSWDPAMLPVETF